MPGDNNFLQFDINKLLMLSDEAYNDSLTRLNGVAAGQASAQLHNKLFYQVTTFIAAFAKAISDNGFNATDIDFNSLVNSIKNYSSIERAYPVGTVYINEDDPRNPHDIFGFGTWVAYAPGRAIIGADGETYIAGEIGGTPTVALTAENNGPHIHPVDPTGVNSDAGGGFVVSGIGGAEDIIAFNTGSSGEGTPHENMQPYIVAYVWKRTA